ncbi:MAG: hypothetical protein HY985_04685 [Magnetospirillum sp.]|nr:hypothetical protein [Magnetospirillum sp.]
MTNEEYLAPPREVSKAVTLLWWIFWVSIIKAAFLYFLSDHLSSLMFPSALGYIHLSFGNIGIRLVIVVISIFATSLLSNKLLEGSGWARIIVLVVFMLMVVNGLYNVSHNVDIVFVILVGLYTYVLKLLFFARGRDWFRAKLKQPESQI